MSDVLRAVEAIVARHIDLIVAVGEASVWVGAVGATRLKPAVDECAHQLDLVDLALGAAVSVWVSSAWRGPWHGPGEVAPLTESLTVALADARVRARDPLRPTSSSGPTLIPGTAGSDGHYLMGSRAISRLSEAYEAWMREFNEALALVQLLQAEPTYGEETYRHTVKALDSLRAAYMCAVEATYRPVLAHSAALPGEQGLRCARNAVAMWMKALDQGGIDAAGLDTVRTSLASEFGEDVVARLPVSHENPGRELLIALAEQATTESREG